MKLLTTLITLFTLVSCSTPNFNKIEGTWMATGYNCENQINLSEKINIIKNNDTYYGIKITGDNCIIAGDTAWFGNVKNDRIIGRIKGINPITFAIEWKTCEIFENLGYLFLSVHL